MKLNILERDNVGLIVVGRELPRCLQIAYGRQIFRTFHAPGQRRSIWLRDLPLSLADLAHDYGFKVAQETYYAECRRVGVAPAF